MVDEDLRFLTRLVFLVLRQNDRFFPEAYLHPETPRQAAGPFLRHFDDLTRFLYERLADSLVVIVIHLYKKKIRGYSKITFKKSKAKYK